MDAAGTGGNPSFAPLFVPEEHVIQITPLGAELAPSPPDPVPEAACRFAGYLDAQRRSLLSRDGKGRDVTRPELVEAYGFDFKFCGIWSG